MSYIGKTPTVGNFQVCDAISVVNNQAAYTMQVGSVNVSPESANHMIVSLNGVIQKPTDAFTVSGSTITFASNLVTGDVINFIQILGNVLDLGVPSDATVSTAKIVDANVTSNKMFSGFANGITNSQQWRITSGFTVATSVTDISSNWEISDATGYATIGSALTESSGIFSFPTTGIWLIMAYANFRGNTGSRGVGFNLKATTNNSTYGFVSSAENNNSDIGGTENTTYHSGAIMAMLDVTNTSNVKFRFTVQATDNTQTCDGDTTRNYTGFTAVRLGNT